MEEIEDGSVDMILCDLPYGSTKNEWDKPIPFDELWAHYHRVSKKNAAIVLFSQGAFTAKLMGSNPKNWRYNLVWDKVLITGFLNANRMPLRHHEDICVFYRALPEYTPQKTQGKLSHSEGKRTHKKTNNNYGAHTTLDNSKKHAGMKHPGSILRFKKDHPTVTVHPTQKPIKLLDFLVRSYSQPGNLVLDSCMGSGSTGVACANAGRDFLGIEKSPKYFSIAADRILKRLERVNAHI